MKTKKVTLLINIIGFIFQSFIFSTDNLEAYFDDHKNHFMAEAVRIINQPEPAINTTRILNISATALSNINFEQIFKSENQFFRVIDNIKLHRYFHYICPK